MDCKRCESRFVVRFWLGNMVELLSDNQRGKRRGHHRVLVQVHRRLVHGFAPPSGFKNGVCFSGAATWASAVQGEPGKRGQVLEEIKKWVDVSESLGAPHLRVFAGKPPAGATVQQAIGWTVDTLKAACEYAGRSITLGMKDHEGITQNADVCLEIVHGVDSPFFGINLDITNFIPTGQADAYAQIGATVPHATHTHIRDRFQKGGAVDLDCVWQLFARADYKGFMSAEYEGDEDPSTGVPTVVDNKTLCRKYSSVVSDRSLPMLNRRSFIQQLSGGAAAVAGSSMFPPARVLGANDRVRFGLIGAGGRGMEIFKAALRAPNTQAVAVADIYSRRLDKARAVVHDLQTHTDFRRLLEDKSIDAVLIATPQHQHALNFVPAIEAGKDVYQEKTMAFNPDHARRMRRAFERSNRVVQVGVQSVSGQAFARAREFSTPDRLGIITAVHAHHYRNSPYGGWKRDIPPDCNLEHVAWKEFEGEAAPHDFDPQRFINWRFFWDYSGGNVFENMVHQVAFWYKALGLKIPRHATMAGYNYLSPEMEVPDTMDVSMDQPENLLFTWNSAFGNNYYGEDGNDLALGKKGTVIRVVDSVSYLPQDHQASTKTQPPSPTGGEPDIVGSDEADTEAHLRNFFHCVRSREEPNCPFELGFRSAIACQMAIASLRQGRTVQWDFEKEDIV